MLTLLIKAVIDDALNKNFKKKHRKDWKAIKNNNKNTKHKKSLVCIHVAFVFVMPVAELVFLSTKHEIKLS